MITKNDLKSIMIWATAENIEKFIEPINQTLEKYEINTPRRIACFLAQIAHESGCLKYVQELASGQAYEGRKDLGNIQPGDGVRFKGRGLIQVTGRNNYAVLSKHFGVDLLANPTLLEGALYASLSAGWFWKIKGLNAICDAGDFQKLTKRINGALNGYEDRLGYYSRAVKTFNL